MHRRKILLNDNNAEEKDEDISPTLAKSKKFRYLMNTHFRIVNTLKGISPRNADG